MNHNGMPRDQERNALSDELLEQVAGGSGVPYVYQGEANRHCTFCETTGAHEMYVRADGGDGELSYRHTMYVCRNCGHTT